MADELEKKPEFVVHKKQKDVTQTTPAASAEKKRVVVVKKKSQQPQNTKPAADASKKDNVHVVVKKAENSSTPQSEKKTPNVQKQNNGQNQGGANQTPKSDKPEQKSKTTFELNPSRPNVKAGNLSDNRNRQNGRNGGFNNKGNLPYHRDGGGFTGAQARQGY